MWEVNAKYKLWSAHGLQAFVGSNHILRRVVVDKVSDERHRVADSIFGCIGSGPLVPASALVDESVAANEKAVGDVSPTLPQRHAVKWALVVVRQDFLMTISSIVMISPHHHLSTRMCVPALDGQCGLPGSSSRAACRRLLIGTVLGRCGV